LSGEYKAQNAEPGRQKGAFLKVIETSLPGVVILEPRVFNDPRGYFLETWSQRRYAESGIHVGFVQDNISCSCKGTLRGLHFQHPHGQGKLVQVLTGSVFDVAVDIRPDAQTFGQWTGVELSADRHNQMYIPPGFAHGFYVLSETALFAYKCTDYYHPETEQGVLWNDPRIGIEWPLAGDPILSEKDARFRPLREMTPDVLPKPGDYA